MAGPSTSGHSVADIDSSKCTQRSRAVSSKYERIVAFVDAHATPVVAATFSSSSFSNSHSEIEEQLPSWHNSYDEEAEEGELHDEPHLLAFTPAVSAQAAGHVAAMAVSTAATASAPAASATANSWSYRNPQNNKPWCYSWDEEAEGAFELAECRQPVQRSREQRRAALHEARHAARLTRRMRRAQLHPQLGDLEHMQAWVGEVPAAAAQQQQRSMPSLQYQQLLALVAGDTAHRQYRKPKAWHLTFDEECHGDQPETVLGSC